MLPWIMLGASVLQNARQREDMRKQALEELMINHARELGADTSPLQAMAQKRAIDRVPLVDPGMLANAIGSTVKSESVNDKLAKEMARRGLMKGYQPFDQEGDSQNDLAAAVKAGQLEQDSILERQKERQGILAGLGGFGGYYGGGR